MNVLCLLDLEAICLAFFFFFSIRSAWMRVTSDGLAGVGGGGVSWGVAMKSSMSCSNCICSVEVWLLVVSGEMSSRAATCLESGKFVCI